MKFCTVCETKLESERDILIDGIKLANGRKICPKCTKPTIKKLDEKAIDEWEKLFGEYLHGKYSYDGYVNTPKNWSKKILDYKSHSNLETTLSNEGHSNKIIQEILGINSSTWIKAFEDKPNDIESIFNRRHYDWLLKNPTTRPGGSFRIKRQKRRKEEEDLKYKIFINTINNLKKEIINWKLTRPKMLIPFSTFVQWTNCKNNKKHSELDLTKVTRLLNYHKYEIILVESNNIVAEHRKTKNCIFLNLIDSTESNNWDISLHILGKLIMNLGKPTGNKSKDVEGFGDWDQGAITKYDWHAYNSRKSRHNALKQRLYVEGFEKTFGTIKALLPLWARNSKIVASRNFLEFSVRQFTRLFN